MKITGSSISKARTYTEIGVFWDEHDLSDYWDSTCPVRAQVQMESEESLYAVEKDLSDMIRLSLPANSMTKAARLPSTPAPVPL